MALSLWTKNISSAMSRIEKLGSRDDPKYDRDLAETTFDVM